MEPLELLYDHYKDSYERSMKEQEKRNKNFVILCVLEALSFFILFNSSKAYEILESFINMNNANPVELSDSILRPLLWIFILYVSIRYCQNTIYVERQYKYIHKLEKRISKETTEFDFNRESFNYLSNRPLVLKFISFFYKWFSPGLFFIINSVRIIIEIFSLNFDLYLIFDIAIYLIISFLCISYISFINIKEEKRKEICQKFKKVLKRK